MCWKPHRPFGYFSRLPSVTSFSGGGGNPFMIASATGSVAAGEGNARSCAVAATAIVIAMAAAIERGLK
jgi:hypothetical protein